MAKKNVNRLASTPMAVVVALGLSLVFNLVTFTLFLEESRERSSDTALIVKWTNKNSTNVLELKKCIEEGSNPCELTSVDAK